MLSTMALIGSRSPAGIANSPENSGHAQVGCPQYDADGRIAPKRLYTVCARRSRLLSAAIRMHPMQMLSWFVQPIRLRYLRWRQRRVTDIALRALNHRTLNDIGLVCSEIDRVLHSIPRSNVRR
jgi:uncharacterized protein YjiS (DUF1127 family)